MNEMRWQAFHDCFCGDPCIDACSRCFERPVGVALRRSPYPLKEIEPFVPEKVPLKYRDFVIDSAGGTPRVSERN